MTQNISFYVGQEFPIIVHPLIHSQHYHFCDTYWHKCIFPGRVNGCLCFLISYKTCDEIRVAIKHRDAEYSKVKIILKT